MGRACNPHTALDKRGIGACPGASTDPFADVLGLRRGLREARPVDCDPLLLDLTDCGGWRARVVLAGEMVGTSYSEPGLGSELAQADFVEFYSPRGPSDTPESPGDLVHYRHLDAVRDALERGDMTRLALDEQDHCLTSAGACKLAAWLERHPRL